MNGLQVSREQNKRWTPTLDDAEVLLEHRRLECRHPAGALDQVSVVLTYRAVIQDEQREPFAQLMPLDRADAEGVKHGQDELGVLWSRGQHALHTPQVPGNDQTKRAHTKLSRMAQGWSRTCSVLRCSIGNVLRSYVGRFNFPHMSYSWAELSTPNYRRGGAPMPVRKTKTAAIAVEPRPDGRWAAQRDGSTRASSLHNTQKQAESAARAIAKRDGLELVVRGRDGTIQRRDSFGTDPPRRRG